MSITLRRMTKWAVRIALFGAFLTVAVWGVLPLGGATLLAHVADRLHLSTRAAAALISSAVGVLGALSLAGWIASRPKRRAARALKRDGRAAERDPSDRR